MEEWFVDPLLPLLLNTRKNSNARGQQRTALTRGFGGAQEFQFTCFWCSLPEAHTFQRAPDTARPNRVVFFLGILWNPMKSKTIFSFWGIIRNIILLGLTTKKTLLNTRSSTFVRSCRDPEPAKARALDFSYRARDRVSGGGRPQELSRLYCYTLLLSSEKSGSNSNMPDFV